MLNNIILNPVEVNTIMIPKSIECLTKVLDSENTLKLKIKTY